MYRELLLTNEFMDARRSPGDGQGIASVGNYVICQYVLCQPLCCVKIICYKEDRVSCLAHEERVFGIAQDNFLQSQMVE